MTGEGYPAWEGVASPRDLLIVSDTIVNVQTGTGNRIEFWDRDLYRRLRTQRTFPLELAADLAR